MKSAIQTSALALAAWCTLTGNRAVASSPAPSAEPAVRQSAQRAKSLIERSALAFGTNVPCATCHHNIMPLWALSVARSHGVAVNNESYRRLALKTYADLWKDTDRAIQGNFFVDPSLEAGQLLAVASSAGVPSTVASSMWARRIASYQRDDGRWTTFDSRPPHSASLFMTTAFNIRALRDQSPGEDTTRRLALARRWLNQQRPQSVDDGAFQLLGLQWAGAPREDLAAAANFLLDQQRPDGSWAQVAGRTPDAFGTGEALYALKVTATIPAASFDRGIKWLVAQQLADGSWLVKTRLHEVAPISPPYMETGFPHGRNQIVSMVGSNWALMALSLALPETPHASDPDLANDLRSEVPVWILTALSGTVEQVRELAAQPGCCKTSKGSTLLMTVAGDPAKVAAVLEAGADPARERAASGITPLHVASTYGHSANVIAQMLAHGADAKPAKNVEFNFNPLIAATFAGDLEAVQRLLDAGAQPAAGAMLQGMVPMDAVAAAVHLDEAAILREFLQRGANPNAVADVPLLSLAALANRAEAATVLLAFGADPQRKDKFGWTPLRHARGVDHDNPLVEKILVDALAKAGTPANPVDAPAKSAASAR